MIVKRLASRLLGRPDASQEATVGPLPRWAGLDPDWYLLAYPEAEGEIAAGHLADPQEHYRRQGAARGHDPNAVFSESWYLEEYADVRQAVAGGDFASGFEHFVACGLADGRRPCGLAVDEAWYRERYPEAAAAILAGRFPSAFEHYLEVGAAEGHDPHAAFSEGWYRERYPEVDELVRRGRYLSGYRHLLERGLAEGLEPHPLYHEPRYLRLNPDVAAEIEEGRLRHGYLHLITRGLAEDRRWAADAAPTELREAASRLARCRLDELLESDRVLDFEAAKRPEISVVLVLFNRAELTLLCLEALSRAAGPSFEVVIADNRSTDRTPDLLGRLRGVTVLRNEENLGFTRAANQAAAEARGELLLFLNNDAEVLPGSLRAAAERLRADDLTGAVGGRVIGLDGRLQEAGAIVWRDATTAGYGRGDDPWSGAYLFPREVDYCSGVFLLTPRRTFERLDGFDERFVPAYYEEADYCFRLRRAGLAVLYEPAARAVHYGSASLDGPRHLDRMLARNRQTFAERHREELEGALEPKADHLFPASERRRFRGRVLVLDDHLPLESLGGGAPRIQQILHAMAGLGYFVTFYATNPVPVDRREVRRQFPEDGIELLSGAGRPGFARLWRERGACYDLLVISREHNFRCLLEEGFDPASRTTRVVYDAECVAAPRRARQRELLGEEAPAGEVELERAELEAELELARQAPEIWAVSEAEAEILSPRRGANGTRAPGRRVSVIASGQTVAPGEHPFEERRGLLFVGRLDEADSPNFDGLSWYLEKVHPRLVERLGAVPTTIVGEPGDTELPRPEGVRFLGRVRDLGPLYEEHRLFVAPARFAAGIPLKILGAAAHGLPVITASLLAGQLGWRDGVELGDGGDGDPERFAERAARICEDAELWQTLRAGALERIRREHSREALARALEKALAPEES